ncbi:hypothetical protein [Paraliomyxa miuraensis]|uniref:hypothetical protein n=1 Tax=Paraliomyxa miuraensis TaxID=376150 RepID=UPI00224DBB51|nr:hypothetical protein [Paraliomyxa miuraensis]MCX4242488.1 hypothetical protein [Paraliomyxa miuraensis]
MTSPRQLWDEIYRRFDPEEPARSSERRAERAYSPADEIGRMLRRNRSDRYVISGTSGSGLSTELYRIAEQRTSDSLVVFLDVHGHFAEHVHDVAALDHVQPWELLVLVGLAVLSAAERRFGHRWTTDERKALEEAVAELAADDGDAPAIDVAKLGSSMAVLAGGAVGGVVGTTLSVLGEGLTAGQWSLPIGIPGRRARFDQDKPVRALLDAVNHLVDALQTTYARRLTLTIDGLDRIRNRDTAEALFVRSNLLTSLACPTVAAGPLVLCRKGRLSSLQGWQPKILANAPVLRRGRPLDFTAPGDGVAFLEEVFRRRTHDLELDGCAIPPPLLRKLAYFSGGRTRDFVRFVRLLSDRCWDRELAVADAQAIDDVIDERRRVLEAGLNRRHVDVLRAVLEDPQHMLPDDDIVDEMLDNWWLLPYPNESEWYQPHPLLMLVKLRSTITG